MYATRCPDGKTSALFDIAGLKYELSGNLTSKQAGFLPADRPTSSDTERSIQIRVSESFPPEVLVTKLCYSIKINNQFIQRH